MAMAAAGAAAANAGRPATAASADGATLALTHPSVVGGRATVVAEVAAARVGLEATAVAEEEGREG